MSTLIFSVLTLELCFLKKTLSSQDSGLSGCCEFGHPIFRWSDSLGPLPQVSRVLGIQNNL